MAKKAEVKSKKEEIKAKKIGKNLVVMIDGDKLVKPNITDKDLKSITTKILIFNKTNTPSKKKEIVEAMKTEVVKAKEVKAVVKKGITKAIKKEVKKSPKKSQKEVDVEQDLIAKVREGHAKGTVTDKDIVDLQDLLKKIELEKQSQAPVVTETSGRSRERY